MLIGLVAMRIDTVGATSPDAGRVSVRPAVIKSRGVPGYKVSNSTAPNTPNPYLSFLPAGSDPDYGRWREKLTADAKGRRTSKSIAAQNMWGVAQAVIPVAEAEPPGSKGINDTQGTAEFVTDFGTGAGDDPDTDITGDLKMPSVPAEFMPLSEDDGDILKASPTGINSGEAVFATGTIGDSPFDDTSITVVNLAAFAEDDGDIGVAGVTNVVPGQQVVIDAEIGDGPHNITGTGSGDFDFYAIEVTDGQQVQVAVTRQTGETVFDSILALYDSSGVLLASNDDVNQSGESAVDHTFSVSGGGSATVYYAVGGWFGNANLEDDFPTDPFDSSTGPGVASEGFYTFSATLPVRESGDFDFYSLSVVEGDRITVEVDTSNHGEILDSIVALFDSAGNVLTVNDDDPDPNETGDDSYLGFVAQQTDTYFIAVGGFNGGDFPTGPGSFPGNPFDSSTGPGTGSKGDYDVIISLNDIDLDYYSFDLEAGDIIGANLLGSFASVQIFAEDETLLVGSAADMTAAYPLASPLPGGGTAAAAYIVSTSGRYAAAVGYGEGAYTLELRAFRPPQEASGSKQKLFVDFDGATVDPDKWGGTPGAVPLSPLSTFLPAWGLTGADENAVIDAILANIRFDLASDVRISGANPTFDIEILNSRDHADPFGNPDGSRIIIGGTTDETGLMTIGTSESIDIGNFDQSEDSLVMLDYLSRDATDLNSLNHYPIGPGSTIIDLIGVGVGNIAAHEAGHFFANFHTDNSNPTPDLMDSGGNMANILGLGDDGIFGTADDVDVTFGLDAYDRFEEFQGLENTRDSVAFGLTTGPAPPFAGILGLPDISSSGGPEVAVLIGGDPNRVYIRDASSDALVNVINFGSDPVIDMKLIGDLDVSGDPDIGLLGIRPSDQMRVFVKDSVTDATTGETLYGSQYVGVGMTVVGDYSGNGLPEVAVMGRDAAERVRVQVRDPAADAFLNNLYYGTKATAHSVLAVPDTTSSGNGIDDLVTLGVVKSSGFGRSHLRDPSTATYYRTQFYNKLYSPIKMIWVPDINVSGNAELALLAVDTSSANVIVQVLDSISGVKIKTMFLGVDNIGIDLVLIEDTNSNGYPDIAVLQETPAGTATVRVRDSFTGANLRNIFFGAVTKPRGIAVLENFADTAAQELAVLGESAGMARVQIRDALSGIEVNTIDFP